MSASPLPCQLAGRLTVRFTISGAGRVMAAAVQESSVGDARVESCLREAVTRWEFPQPRGGGAVVVSYPFVLVPAGDAAP